jgi:hypothetical protein
VPEDNTKNIPNAPKAGPVTPAALPKDEQKKPDTITVSPLDAPGTPSAPDVQHADEVATMQAELTEKQAELELARSELAALRSRPAAPVEVELETGAPKWVRVVSGMERGEIKGYTVLGGNVLAVEDRKGGLHRFTFLPSQAEL